MTPTSVTERGEPYFAIDLDPGENGSPGYKCPLCSAFAAREVEMEDEQDYGPDNGASSFVCDSCHQKFWAH